MKTVKIVVHQKYGSSAVPNKTAKFGRNHVRGGTAAFSGGIRVSYQKNATTIRTEMKRGASTPALVHPSVLPDVIAKMKRISAAVRIDTPTRSSECQRGPAEAGRTLGSCGGTRMMHMTVMSAATMATNQNTQDQSAYCTKIAPIISPRTIGENVSGPKHDQRD